MRAVAAHANEHAGGFYDRFGFEASPTDPLHRILLMERAHGQRHRISEEQRSRRLLALLACLLVLGSAAILAQRCANVTGTFTR